MEHLQKKKTQLWVCVHISLKGKDSFSSGRLVIEDCINKKRLIHENSINKLCNCIKSSSSVHGNNFSTLFYKMTKIQIHWSPLKESAITLRSLQVRNSVTLDARIVAVVIPDLFTLTIGIYAFFLCNRKNKI